MEEQEIPTEHLQDEISEKASEKMREERERWTLYVALSTAVMAVLAALAGLLSGDHANEALIAQIKSSDQWNYYQSKSIKSEIAIYTGKIMKALPAVPGSVDDSSAMAKYEKDRGSIRKTAEEDEAESAAHLKRHETLSKAVTIFQIAIAISAISILTRRKLLWYCALVLTAAGSVFLIFGVI
jgi:hypothetical protein